ncbi:O-antigen ligase family protein [Candidatus Omnitrophota bacterium]
MKRRSILIIDFVIYWSIIIVPFSMAISIAAMNVFAGFLLVGFLIKKAIKKEALFNKTALNKPLLILFAITVLSLFNTIDLTDSLKGGVFKLLRYILVFFIILQELKDAKHARRAVFSMVFGVVFASLDGIWQVATGHDFVRGYEPIINLGLVRATASFKDANTFGIYLSAIAPLLLGMTLFYFKRRARALFIALSLLVLLAALLTYSRPTLLALYVALFFLAIARKNKGMIIFLVILTLLSPFLLPASIKEWAGKVEYNPIRFMCNDDRIAIYQHSFNMIKAHPLLGVGANTYMKNYRFYKNSPEYRNIVTSDYIYAHNNFLHMAAEIGLAGLAVFFWLLYQLFRQGVNIYRKLQDDYLRVLSLSLSACLIAFLINGLTESSLYYSRVSLLFWYLAGFSIALKKFSDADRAKNS